MLTFYNDVEELVAGGETGEAKVNYQLLLAAQDCLNVIVLQFHKMDPVAHGDGSGNQYDRESFDERLKFLEYGSSMEVFIYQTKKYYSLITAFAKQIGNRELLELIPSQESIIINKVETYISRCRIHGI
ncbi:hypothetical protein [Domibacillus iocasae]|uniref:Uncharacterized protein n=1 Tax=Domibacillus iocasae TaxID=1714016 RepID=A0A1E7DS10_9BACI|nr:hypothetical protein [Domibacillus iocasae]OES45795.1 hypothetical protein BA724_03040 [Domibacillus iocasae]